VQTLWKLYIRWQQIRRWSMVEIRFFFYLSRDELMFTLLSLSFDFDKKYTFVNRIASRLSPQFKRGPLDVRMPTLFSPAF
jgi:hypothetical protein